MMRFIKTLAPLLLLTACAVPIGPVEVSRFHVADASPLGHGTVAVVPGPGMDGSSLELQSYQIAVERELSALGYTAAPPDSADQVAAIRLVRTALSESRNPVGVSIGASGSNYGSGAGVGISIPIRTAPSQQTATDLIAVIRDRASGKALWEGANPIGRAQAGAGAVLRLSRPIGRNHPRSIEYTHDRICHPHRLRL
jgi:hypothetical protein